MRSKLIAVLGLTFKPNTDDIREAPSIAIITALQHMGAFVRAYDPAGMEQARKSLIDVDYAADPYECAENADALVIVTEWEQFRAPDLARLRQVMATPVVVDLRKIYPVEEMTRNGFVYSTIGSRAPEHISASSPKETLAALVWSALSGTAKLLSPAKQPARMNCFRSHHL